VRVSRDGASLTICDGCYRPQRASERGWIHATRTLPHRSPDEVQMGAPAASTETVEADYCPDCDPAALPREPAS
jgi:hypothetical protein